MSLAEVLRQVLYPPPAWIFPNLTATGMAEVLSL